MGTSMSKKNQKVSSDPKFSDPKPIHEIEREEEEEKKLDHKLSESKSQTFSQLSLTKPISINKQVPKKESEPKSLQNLKKGKTNDKIKFMEDIKESESLKNSVVERKDYAHLDRLSILINKNDKKIINSSTLNSSNLHSESRSNSVLENRKIAYIEALRDDLEKKKLPDFFINDSIVLMRSYMNVENWVRLIYIIQII